jgi:hypothetical protein
MAFRLAYDVKDGPVGVAGVLILCGVSDKALLIGEGDPGRCNTITLIVDHDFNLACALSVFA